MVAEAAQGAVPRTPSAVINLAHLNECCRSKLEAVDSGGFAHPHAPFMQRAIELSRIAGLEKRTGGAALGDAEAGGARCGRPGRAMTRSSHADDVAPAPTRS
jgi:hypothetical protein